MREAARYTVAAIICVVLSACVSHPAGGGDEDSDQETTSGDRIVNALPTPPLVGSACEPGPFIVFFDYDSAALRDETLARIDSLAVSNQVRACRRKHLVRGFTDRAGPESYNLQLAQRRLDSVVGYMVERGIDPADIQTEVVGEHEFLVQTEDGVRHPENRRVEISYLPGM